MHEMVSRATKHVLSRYLRKLPLLHVSTCVSHLLNCLVGFKFNALPKPHFSPDDEFDDFSQAKWTEVTVRGLQEEITREVFKRFRYRLNHEWWSQSSCIVLLREVCLKLGFQLKARTYLFDRNENCPAKPKKATNGTNGHHVEETTFYPEDIMNVVPVIKDAPMKSVLAEEAYDAGKAALLQSRKELGIDLLAESLSLHEQIYGVLHPDVARGYSKLSLIYNQLDEMRATACELARKAVIVSERTLGLDNQETILNWLNWALCEHSNGNTKVALSFIIHVLSIWRNIFGEGHPDEVTMMVFYPENEN
jgi:protein TIF31